MTWNMLVTQAAYSFAQARGQRTGKNLSSALVTKPGPSWPPALSRPGGGRGGAGSWQWGGVDGEGVQWVSGSQVSDAPLIIFLLHVALPVTGLEPRHLWDCALSPQMQPFHDQTRWAFSSLSFLGMLLGGEIVKLFLVLFVFLEAIHGVHTDTTSEPP